MKLTIVTTVLLGLLLAPAHAENLESNDGNKQIVNRPNVKKLFAVDGGQQTLTINSEWPVATIEEKSTRGSWKTIWNYDTGFIITKVLSERTCFISIMNRRNIPKLDALPSLAQERMNVQGQGQPAKEITFVIMRRVRDLQTYGPAAVAMCRGIPAYITNEVNGPEYTYQVGSCASLNALHLLELKYCHANVKVRRPHLS